MWHGVPPANKAQDARAISKLNQHQLTFYATVSKKGSTIASVRARY
jgi:hypothetical protein